MEGIKQLSSKEGMRGRDYPDDSYDPEQLAMGIKVELEHTDDIEEAKAIAKDHLAEIPDYYTRLHKMEDEAEDEYELDESFSEGMIPKVVWDFVKKLIKNPIKAGILALLVWNFLRKNQPQEEKWEETLAAISEQDIKTIVANDEWQKIRASMVGTWKDKPAENVKRLRRYLGDNPQEVKLRRVMNYLTGSGFRSGQIKHEDIQKLRDWVSKKLASAKEDAPKGYEERLSDLMEAVRSGKDLVELLNRHAFVPIKDEEFAAKLIDERIGRNLNHSIFSNLSRDKSSGRLFKKPAMDPTLGAFFVDIEYASRNKGNRIDQKGVDKVKELIQKGTRLSSVPGFEIRRNSVGEGNHRVEALKQLGYKSVPMQMWDGWD